MISTLPRILSASPFVPPEWIAAHGMRPGRIFPSGPSTGPLIRPQEGLCPFAQSVANTAFIRTDAAGVVLATTCDQMRRVAGELVESAKRVFLLNVPACASSTSARELYRYELMRLGRWLCELGGQPPSAATLSETLRRYDENRRKLSSLPNSLSALEKAKQWMAFHADPEQADEAAENPRGTGILPVTLNKKQVFFNTACSFSEASNANLLRPDSTKPVPESQNPLPIAILGGSITQGELWIYDFLPRCGAGSLLDITEIGPRCLPSQFNHELLRSDPLEALVRAYLNIPDVFQRPNTAFYDWLDRKLHSFGVQGLVILRWVWCDLWAGESQRIMERYRLPSTLIELTGEEGARKQIETRLAALMEAVKGGKL